MCEGREGGRERGRDSGEERRVGREENIFIITLDQRSQPIVFKVNITAKTITSTRLPCQGAALVQVESISTNLVVLG